jgi:hypothetical protein
LEKAGIPFLFHSGHADPKKLEQRYPSSRVCQKPCHPRKLLNELAELTGVNQLA